jgi:hypothetical protein
VETESGNKNLVLPRSATGEEKGRRGEDGGKDDEEDPVSTSQGRRKRREKKNHERKGTFSGVPAKSSAMT